MDSSVCFAETFLMILVDSIRLVRYALVGIITTIVYLGVGAILQLVGLSINQLALLAFTAAVTVNFLMQRSWVFSDSKSFRDSLPRYIIMISIGYVINSLTLILLNPLMPLLFAQFTALILVVISNAIFSFLWVFSRR